MTTPATTHSTYLYTRTVEMHLTLRSIASLSPADADEILRDVMSKHPDMPRDLLVALTRRACAKPKARATPEKVRPPV